MCTQVCRKTTTTPKQHKVCGLKRNEISLLCDLLTPKPKEAGLTKKKVGGLNSDVLKAIINITVITTDRFHIYIVFLCF